MFNDAIMAKLSQHFPGVQIKFKNESLLMKILGVILFFSPRFMEHYTTTIGSTIYFPSRNWLDTRQNTALLVLLHELIHVSDAQKIGKLTFEILYLAPLSLIPIALLSFFFSWKIGIICLIFCLSPVPAYFRMLLERRAYFCSMYAEYEFNKKGFNINLESQRDFFITQFTGSAYYFMWILPNIKTEFVDALNKIKLGQRPYDNLTFDIIDDFISVI